MVPWTTLQHLFIKNLFTLTVLETLNNFVSIAHSLTLHTLVHTLKAKAAMQGGSQLIRRH